MERYEFEGAEEAIIDIASADGPAGPGSVAADDDPGFGRDADARR